MLLDARSATTPTRSVLAVRAAGAATAGEWKAPAEGKASELSSAQGQLSSQREARRRLTMERVPAAGPGQWTARGKVGLHVGRGSAVKAPGPHSEEGGLTLRVL